MQVVNKAAIDLELADRQLLEIAEAGVSCAKIVNRKFHAECLQLAQDLESHVFGCKQKALRNLQFQKFGIEFRLFQHRSDQVAKTDLTKLNSRDVHCHRNF